MQRTLFPPEEFYSIQYKRFLTLELGQIYKSLPLEELASMLPHRTNPSGAKGRFDNKGKIALQFLKSYTGLSDKKLLARLNTDWAFQMFCGLLLGPNEALRDKDLIWKTRAHVAAHLDVEAFQAILIKHWKPWMKDLPIGLSDATCYESYIKYPTDQKLLWDCCEWLHKQTKRLCKVLGLKRPRNKFGEQAKKQDTYAKQRRKTYKQRRSRSRQLLYLCNKLLFQLEELLAYCFGLMEGDLFLGGVLDEFTLGRFRIIGKIYEQQRFHYDNPGERVPNRIVSLFKPYIRPIVRGKELKRVEFGAKLNTWQVDGINFIEHFSFEAFHEGNRLKKGIAFHQKYFGKLKLVGADSIYATNANRTFTAGLNIGTCFRPKGRRKSNKLICQQEDKARKVIGTARATILEGSYGNDKNHYGLRKVKARNQLTEISWIFFGIMTANAVKIAKRKIKLKKERPRKAAA